MSGFFGVVSKEDCVCDLFYGTDYHSHLGTRRGGMAVTGSKGNIVRRIHDISNAQFRSKFDGDLDDLHGRSGIGIISDYEDQPLLITARAGTYAIVTVGRIDNIIELSTELIQSGAAHFAESFGGEINPTELVAALINRKNSLVEGIIYAQERIQGSCSMLILQGNSIFAARDRYGRTPILIGEKDGAFAVTMESTAFPNLDYQWKHDLGPGEIVQITEDKIVQKKAPGDTMKMCAFFWIYYGYPSSTYEQVNAEVARCRNGESLAARDDRDSFDSVCGIPDSGIPHAIGYSNAIGKPYLRAFVKYTPTWPRSFMPQNQKVRDLVARMKLIPVRDQIEGKRLLFCDDSIVRGTQMRDTVKQLYGLGAKEVHMRSACPPLVFPCKFLNFSRSRSAMDLAARRAIAALENGNVSPENMDRYVTAGTPEYEAMVDQVRQELNLTTLKYQHLDAMIEAIGLPAEKICTYCWTGQDVEKK